MVAVPLSLAAAAPGHVTTMHGLSFRTTMPLSSPEAAGLDALRVVLPKDGKPGTERMSVTAVRFGKEAVGEGGMSDMELLEYVKSTFLGSTAKGTPMQRTLLAKTCLGQAFRKSIPAPSRAEVYVLPRGAEGKVVLAFVFAPDFLEPAEQVIAEIAASLRE